MDFELSADQVALRDGIRSLCEGRFPIKRVRGNRKAFQGIEQRLVGEAVVVPIQHIRWIFGSRPRARGLKYHPIHGIYKLMDAWVV